MKPLDSNSDEEPKSSDPVDRSRTGYYEGGLCLYRHFDAQGTLLYVGSTGKVFTRLIKHQKDSFWFSHITRIEIERFDTVEELLAAEREAIATENPKHNKLGKPKE